MGKSASVGFPPFFDMVLSSPPQSNVSMGANPYWPSLTPEVGGGPNPPNLGETKNAPISTIFGFFPPPTTPVKFFNGGHPLLAPPDPWGGGGAKLLSPPSRVREGQ